MAIYLTTSGLEQAVSYFFAPSHHFSPDFLGMCVHYYYICNVNILTPVHAPPDCHNAVGLMTTLSLSAFANVESRENDHAAQPYKYITGNGIKNENILRRELGKEERKEDEHPE